jgi:hypothetical protein
VGPIRVSGCDVDDVKECAECGAPGARGCVDVDAYVDDTGAYATHVPARCRHDGRATSAADRARAIDAMGRAAAWTADVARIVGDAREAAAAGDMDRAAAMLRAAVTAVNAVRHDIGYARIALGLALDPLT